MFSNVKVTHTSSDEEIGNTQNIAKKKSIKNIIIDKNEPKETNFFLKHALKMILVTRTFSKKDIKLNSVEFKKGSFFSVLKYFGDSWFERFANVVFWIILLSIF